MPPAVAPKDFERLKEQSLAGIAAAKQEPNGEAGHILPTLLFGDDSAYGQLTTEAAVQSIDRKDVERLHSRWFHPHNATLVVTGDADLADIRQLLEDVFADWKPGTRPATVMPRSGEPQSPVVYLSAKQIGKAP